MSEAAESIAISQAEFARQQGWAKSYVSKLKGEGRLVLTTAGRVDVAASLERIKATSGAPERADPSVQGALFAGAQDRERFYSAELKRLELEREIGKVMPVDQVRSCIDDAAALIRSSVEAWAVRLPAQLAALGADERRIGALLSDEAEALLRTLAERFAALTSGEAVR